MLRCINTVCHNLTQNAERCHAECHSDECRYVEGRGVNECLKVATNDAIFGSYRKHILSHFLSLPFIFSLLLLFYQNFKKYLFDNFSLQRQYF
jgi:hypothetical protein